MLNATADLELLTGSNSVSVSTPVPYNTDEEDDDDEDAGDKRAILIIPYVILTLFLLAMALSSFFHYHVNNKGKYQVKKKVTTEYEKPTEQYPNKYRVTMSRNAKISQSNFNIVDFMNNYFLYDEESASTVRKYLEPQDQTQYAVVDVHNTGSNMAGTSGTSNGPSSRGKDIEMQVVNNNNKGRKSRILPTPRDSQGNVIKTPTSLPGSRDIYVNEGYSFDSNAESEKSLIGRDRRTSGVKTVQFEQPFFDNDSYESHELSPVEMNSNLGDRLIMNPRKGKLGKYTVSSKGASKGKSSRGKFNPDARKTLVNSVSEHIPDHYYAEPDLLMHSGYSSKTESPRKKLKLPERPQTLDLSAASLNNAEKLETENNNFNRLHASK